MLDLIAMFLGLFASLHLRSWVWFVIGGSWAALDIDELLLRATTGDEHAGGGAPNGSGTPCIDSTHHHLDIKRRRRSDREGDSPRPHSANNGNGQNPGHVTTTANPYPPQHHSNVSYPANQLAPVMNSLSHQHKVVKIRLFKLTFAPIATDAPTKTKFPNTIQAGPGGGAGLPGMPLSLLFTLFFSIIWTVFSQLRSALILPLIFLFHLRTSDYASFPSRNTVR